MLVTGCRERRTPDPLGDRLCASACATLSAACAAIEQGSCVDACPATRADAEREGCRAVHDAFLSCISARHVRCAASTSARAVLTSGAGLEGCAAELGEYERCSAPCREAGVVRTATRAVSRGTATRTVQAEQVSAGCGRASAVPRGAPPDSPCQAASVCRGARCPCAGSPVASLVRACVDGHCASPELACELVPQAVGHDVCEPPK